jgi:hypothetical protein
MSVVQCLFDWLPNEILAHIFLFLPLNSFVPLVCYRWNGLLKQKTKTPLQWAIATPLFESFRAISPFTYDLQSHSHYFDKLVPFRGCGRCWYFDYKAVSAADFIRNVEILAAQGLSWLTSPACKECSAAFRKAYEGYTNVHKRLATSRNNSCETQ